MVFRDAAGKARAAPFENGNQYCIKDLAPGLYEVEAWAQGHERRVVEVLVPSSRPFDIYLEQRASIRVGVQDETGRPLQDLLSAMTPAEAEMVAQGLEVVMESKAAAGSGEGASFIRELSSAAPDLLGWIEGVWAESRPVTVHLQLGATQLDTQTLDATQDEVLFRVGGLVENLVELTISVVSNQTGMPVSKGMIVLQVAELRTMTTLTDAGLYRARVPRGEVQVTYLPGDHESAQIRHEIPAGVDAHEIIVKVGPGVGIQGTLRSLTAGCDLEDTSVFAYQATSDGDLAPIGLPCLADPDGSFSMATGAGTFYLHAEPTPGGPDLVSDYLPIEVGSARVQNLVVDVDAPARVTLRNGSDSNSTGFRLLRNELTLLRGNLEPNSSRSLALWPGPYSLEERRAGRVLDVRAINPLPGTNTEIVLGTE